MSVLNRAQIPKEDLFVLATILFSAAYVAGTKRVLDKDGKDMHYLAFGHQSARDLFESMGMGSLEAETVNSQAQKIVELLGELGNYRS